ncbi:AraC family transcriptional regulator ligand-binding domain-containing protein [Bacillus sp. 3255]|uniref:AraC family transcriptional regulator ligand-binding domain-containing protein n=1 Tax=Bacillus sp. 3255 TaxID=2817904 RepID=UPI002854EE08|nr:AraC family transcriptional regulator ligand-binding domain-containing protein [Bacillus sp. 3255]MDR6884042.1 AraC-like DNA-binding protein [Bacillus sp. 3255]
MKFERIKFPNGFWAGLQHLGISPHDVVRKAQLPLSLITEQAAVTSAEYFSIWQAYADLIGGTAIGIVKLVNVFETTQYPPTVLATYHARDYRDALNRMARYKQLCPPESLRITEEGERCTIELAWMRSEQAGPPVLTGATLAFLLELGRRGTGKPLTARSVEFIQPMDDIQLLEAYFGCPVRAGAAVNRLTLHRRDLEQPFTSYNQELLEVLTPILDQSLDEHRSRPVPEMVKWILKRSLSGGHLDMRAVARELGMSNRTLQRRLTDEGTTFKQLLTQARHEQSLEYLKDPKLELKEVAFLIGYTDQNSFYRAFRLWEGDTPANWRSAYVRS